MIEFVKKLLPDTGCYCVGRAVLKKDGKFWLDNTFWPSKEDAYNYMKSLDKAGHTVFMAQSGFREGSEHKTQANVIASKSFWIDVDCGESKDYKTQVEGIKAIKEFCSVTGLPLPAIVNSGNGLYTHWPMDRDLLPSQWQGVANGIKKLYSHYTFKFDDSRTSDISSVLRAIGSHHKKDPLNPKLVRLIYDTPPFNFDEFAEIIRIALEAAKIDTRVFTPPEISKLNDEFSAGLNESFQSDADLVASKCQQIGLFKTTLGNIQEPLWYAGIGVLKFTVNGEDIIHKWSVGHEDYSVSATQRKIEQHKVAPTTCHYFGEINPTGCVGCTHNGKVKTPLTLGRIYKHIELEDGRVEMPKGFILTDSGILTKEDNKLVYPYDLYPSRLAYDETLGYETVTITHKTPFGVWENFEIRSSLIHDPKAFLIALHDNHVQITGVDGRKLIIMYMEEYIKKLRNKKRMTRLFSQMGWQTEEGKPIFVLGDKILRKQETPVVVGYANNVPEVVKSYTAEGEFAAWRTATSLIDKPSLSAHAFMFLAGAFGAPLLHFTGYPGAMISAVGSSGAGKSLMQYLIQSVYGDHRKLVMVADDTSNALISRLGVCGSMPMTIDEVTNMEPQRVSDLAYRITQGRDKVRLSRSAVEKTNINSWCTLAVVSSNASLVDKLAALKGNASAEINRIFEFYVPNVEEFTRNHGTYIHNLISNNYGHAGLTYIQYLINHYEDHAEKLRGFTDKLMTDFNMVNEERFWCAIMAVTIYGGLIAKKLGLIDINITALYKWLQGALVALRASKNSSIISAPDIIGEFLDKYAANVVIVGKASNAFKSYTGYKIPVGAIMARFDVNTNICYLNRSALSEYLNQRGMSITAVRKELESTPSRPALICSNKRRVLTAGLNTVSSAAIYTWDLDLKHPVFGNVVMELINHPSISDGLITKGA